MLSPIPSKRLGIKPSLGGRRLRGGALLASLIAAFAAGCGDDGGGTTETKPSPLPGTAYEIFVRSFADSNGDGIGDLPGLTAHVDYLGELGVQAVWLMPIYPSPSYHGYDVTDYRTVNQSYGTMADMDAFIAAAHQRGIKVLLDFIVNHSSDQHPWFVDSASGATSAKRDWYVWRDSSPGWKRPWDSGATWYTKGGFFYYGLFCGCMPDLNLANSAVEAEITDSMKFWLARGVDGFRLDAARYFVESPDGMLADQPGTHALLARLRAAMPGAVLVSEVAASLEIQASYYGKGDESQLAFSFELADAIKTAAKAGAADGIIRVLGRTETAIKDRGFEAPFLSNHDQVRVMRAINDAAAMRVAAATLFAMPGTPFVYYGEEIGMSGGASTADQNKRTAFHWNANPPGFGFSSASPWFPSEEGAGIDVASQKADPGSLWNLYKALIALRRAQPALGGGDATRPLVSGGGAGVLAVLRTAAAGGRVLFVANFAGAASGPFTVDVAGSPTMLLAEGLAGAPAVASGKLSISDLAARGFAYVALP